MSGDSKIYQFSQFMNVNQIEINHEVECNVDSTVSCTEVLTLSNHKSVMEMIHRFLDVLPGPVRS